jgi:hypothetical protein
MSDELLPQPAATRAESETATRQAWMRNIGMISCLQDIAPRLDLLPQAQAATAA